MASQGATLQNYNNELVKCTQLCLCRNMPVKRHRRAGGAGRAQRPSHAAPRRVAPQRYARRD